MTPPEDPPAGIAVCCEAVEKRFGATTATGPASFELAAGRAAVLRGGNGSGKTTLLRCLAGRVAPSSGRVLLDGRPADERASQTRRDVAFLSGTVGLFGDLTLTDHLVLVDSTWGRDPATCADRVSRALDEVGLTHLADRFPHELSSGQGQLVQLMLTLFRPARLLLLDEPEQRLDDDRRRLVADLLGRRRDAGVTVIVATHDTRLASSLADDTLTLDADDDR